MIECWDHERAAKHRLVGTVERSLNELIHQQGQKMEIVNEESGMCRRSMRCHTCVYKHIHA